MSAHDPYASYNFLVEVSGITAAGFAEVSGLEVEIESIEYREGNSPTTGVRKFPGLAKFANIVLKRGVAGAELWEWMQNILDGNIDRRSGSIILLNQARDEVARWNFFEGWPCKWEGPSLSATKSGIAFETVEICHERLLRA
ncbi:MAG: phage tail protein [Planctomycetota bacterium]|nr:phage tail protein [Planctomycetota bacterium]